MDDSQNSTMAVIPFRYPVEQKRKLKAIKELEGHETLSDTVRAACDAFIASKLPNVAA